MSKPKSKLPKILALAALVVLAAIIVLAVAALKVRSHLSPDGLVAKLEKTYNLRAQVGDIDAKIFAVPSRVILSDLAIAPRDEAAKNQTPLSQRDPIPENNLLARADKVELEIDLRDLLRGELNVKKLLLHGLAANLSVNKDGKSTIATILEEPKGAKKPKADPDKEKKAKPLRLPIATTMAEVGITPATITITNQEKGFTTTLEGLEIGLTDIDLDPSRPAERNRCQLSINTRLLMANLQTGEPFLDFHLQAGGDATPLDPATGALDPAFSGEISVAKGSSISGLPLLQMLSGSLDALARIGLTLGDLSAEGELVEETRARADYIGGKLAFLDDIDLNFPRYSMGLSAGSWLNTDTLAHDFKGGLSASKELTDQAREGVREFLRKKAGKTAAEIGADTLLDSLISSAGKLTLQFVSTGPLPDPKVGLVTPIPDVGDLLENIGGKLIEGKGGIEGLLKGLIDK